MVSDNIEQAYYYGCWHGYGHYLHDRRGNRCHFSNIASFPIGRMPFISERLQELGCIPQNSEGVVRTIKHGSPYWIVIAYWDQSIDHRLGALSVFFAKTTEILSTIQVAQAFKRIFPHVIARRKSPLLLPDGTDFY